MNGKVLIDTSAFYALASEADEFHQRAVSAQKDLIDHRAELYTTSYVLVEAISLIHRRLGFSHLAGFVDSVREGVSILWMDRRNTWRSWELLQQRGGGQLNFVDCSTIIMAQDTRSAVFAFDRDFVREGLNVIPASGG